MGSYSYFVYDDLGGAGWAATSTAAGTFSEYDHLVIGSYSYFVYDDLGGAGRAVSASVAGTFLNLTTLFYVRTHTLSMMI
jgi:hypothetical protein